MSSVDQLPHVEAGDSLVAAGDVSFARSTPDFVDLIEWGAGTEQWLPLPSQWAERLAPATFGAWEYRPYRFQLREADSIRIGDGRSVTPRFGRWFELQFENVVGTVQLTAMRSGGHVSKPLWVEVLSAKVRGVDEAAETALDTALQAHVAFFDALIGDLAGESEILPTMLERLAERAFSPVPREPHDFFSYIVLRNFADRIIQAPELVLADPHRRLVAVEDRVGLHEVSHVDASVLLDALTSPRRVRPGQGEEMLAGRFGGTLPARWTQPRVELTHDTPENRFVLHVLESIQDLTLRLQEQCWWSRVPVIVRGRIDALGEEVRVAVRHPVLREVGRMRVLPLASQVLIRKEGYRDLRFIWELLHQALVPLQDDLSELIHLRRVDKLYEFWCMVSLLARIRAFLPGEPFDLRVEGGMSEPALVARFGTRYELRSQVRFSPGRILASYSVPLVPDFAWFDDGAPRVVFDAKYRLADGQFVPGKEASASDDAIYKMHTYRDALEGVRAAVCLYPGSREDLFEVRQGRAVRSEAALSDVLLGNWEGVGSLGMRPDFERSSG